MANPTYRISYRNMSRPLGESRGTVDVTAKDMVSAMTAARDKLKANGDKIEIIDAKRLP